MLNIHARQVERLHVVPSLPLPSLPPVGPTLPSAPAPMQCVDCNRKTWRRHQHVEKLSAPRPSNVVSMLREATKRGNRLALVAGAVLGGASSVALYTELHPLPPLLSIPGAIALGRLLARESIKIPLHTLAWNVYKFLPTERFTDAMAIFPDDENPWGHPHAVDAGDRET